MQTLKPASSQPTAAQSALAGLTINSDRLHQSLFRLAEIGKLPNGGVSRVAFTTEDVLARQLVQSWMEEAGMQVHIDAAGNIIGCYAGIYPDAPVLATGSHIDTVPVAGRYDGCLGVLAGIEVVRVLHENHLRLDHSIEVIVFTDEESSVIGCKAMAGEIRVDNPDYYRRKDGTPIEPCLMKVGGDWSKISTAKRVHEVAPGQFRSDIAAFVELHVEQGSILERAGIEIGVVTGVVGQYRFAVDVAGSPNHAGTTPMNQRKDALLAASMGVVAVNRIAVETPGEQVGTVGYLTVTPNATNTVAAQVDFRIDLRDLSQAHLEALVEKIRQELATIAQVTDTDIEMRETFHVLPTLANPQIMTTIEAICQQQGLSHCRLPSRAGHDAQEIGRFTDMGMIFVPSQAGISHSEKEYTSPEQCAQGTDVLLQTFLQLDQVYPI